MVFVETDLCIILYPRLNIELIDCYVFLFGWPLLACIPGSLICVAQWIQARFVTTLSHSPCTLPWLSPGGTRQFSRAKSCRPAERKHPINFNMGLWGVRSSKIRSFRANCSLNFTVSWTVVSAHWSRTNCNQDINESCRIWRYTCSTQDLAHWGLTNWAPNWWTNACGSKWSHF